MSASERQAIPMAIEQPSHPTYDLEAVIGLALAEDAGDRGLLSLPLTLHFIFVASFLKSKRRVVLGDVTSLATIPGDAEVEAHFLVKEDGVIAGIGLAEMVFRQVDPSLKVLFALSSSL